MATVGARLRQKLDVSRTACRSDWQPRTAPAPAAEFSASINSHRQTFRVVPAFVNVRDAPSLTAYLLCRRWEGELIEAIEERDGWIRDASEYGSVSEKSPVLSPKLRMSSIPSLCISVSMTLAIGVPSGALRWRPPPYLNGVD